MTVSHMTVYRDGHYVSRRSDLIIYSVEAASIDQVVATYGPCKFSVQQSSFAVSLTLL
jgi:prephenate dehydrogenase